MGIFNCPCCAWALEQIIGEKASHSNGMQTLFSSFILVLFQKIGIEAALYLSPLNLDIRKRYAFQLPQMEYARFPGAADEPPRADALWGLT